MGKETPATQCSQDVSQECVLHELGNKTQLGVWGRDGKPEGKALGKLTTLSLKLV